jgi:biopolymer transport protein ExbD
VLLVIFILMTTASVQGIKVNLPKASNAPSLAKPTTKAITITQDGNLYLDAFPMASLQELESRLLTYKASTPEFPIVVKGDSAVQYQKVMDVLDLLGRIELTQIGLVTQRLVK